MTAFDTPKKEDEKKDGDGGHRQGVRGFTGLSTAGKQRRQRGACQQVADHRCLLQAEARGTKASDAEFMQ